MSLCPCYYSIKIEFLNFIIAIESLKEKIEKQGKIKSILAIFNKIDLQIKLVSFEKKV